MRAGVSRDAARDGSTREPAVAVVGLGYVGLPTSLGLAAAGMPVIGIDTSSERIAAVAACDVDLSVDALADLKRHLDGSAVRLTTDPHAVAAADAVLICVPTPVGVGNAPELRYLREACRTVVSHAREGQTIVLTSTSHVGTTREFLIEPLEAKGLTVGHDVRVAFSPERIDPGSQGPPQSSVPRVVGGATEACARLAARVLDPICAHIHLVTSPEVAELTKLYENTFRAVNIALANEFADIGHTFGLDPMEVTEAAATKPYGFMPFYPGAGAGGHCIPCDPHYLLAKLERADLAPITTSAMGAIAKRPVDVAEKAGDLALSHAGPEGARALVIGASYKPGVRDVRESPGLKVIHHLRDRGIEVSYHDPLVPELRLPDGETLVSVEPGRMTKPNVTVAVTLHPGHDYEWIEGCRPLLDYTFSLNGAGTRV